MSQVLVKWAIALHGMYESALVFISIFKQKNLYIVCAMWHLGHNSIFTFARIKILLWKINKWMLYLWLLEITKVRIRFQNYLFKADKRISHHLGPHRIFLADRIRILLPKKKLFAALWLLEIIQKNKLYSEFIWRI